MNYGFTKAKSSAAATLVAIFATAAVQAESLSGCPISGAREQKSWDADCAAAIKAERDPAKRAELYLRRAYVENDREAYEKALEDLNEAVALVPRHASYLHERAYTLNSLGRYREALADLNEEAELNPQSAGVYSERAMARDRLGDFEGALSDRDQEVKLSPNKSALISRAEAQLWVGKFDTAQADLDAAQPLPDSHPEDADYLKRVAAKLRAWTHHSDGDNPAGNCSRAEVGNGEDFSRPTLIGDCTRAFLAAKTPAEKADALTSRGIAWLTALQSQHDATADYQAAAALDPNNPDRHTNLGFAYIQESHSWAARQEFDRSIAIRKTPMALAGRAAAQYNLQEANLAFHDAKESFELKPNPLSLLILGDLMKDKHDNAAAKTYWMGAYKQGMRDDRLMERLKRVGVVDPEKETSERVK